MTAGRLGAAAIALAVASTFAACGSDGDPPDRAPLGTEQPSTAGSDGTPEITPRDDRPVVRFGDHAILAELADESTEITLGLMHRRRLGENAGMLFLFPFSVRTEFWMKNTLIPLSIAFLRQTQGRTFEVVSILDMEPCRLPADESDDCPLYQPTRSYDVALEVNQGWFDRAGVETGAEAVIEGPLTGRFE